MLNVSINRKSPLLKKGEYTCTVTRNREVEGNKAILTITVDEKPYQVWLDASRQITLNDGTITTPAQLVVDAIVAQCSDDVLDVITSVEELMSVLVQESATLTAWVTVYEERLNNFSFFKPKTWDEEDALGIA